MEIFTVHLTESLTLTFEELTPTQFHAIYSSPRLPDPEPSDVWKESGMPKEQSEDWQRAKEAHDARMFQEALMRQLGKSFIHACRSDPEANKPFIEMLLDAGAMNYLDGMQKRPDPTDELNVTAMLLDGGRIIGYNTSLYVTKEEEDKGATATMPLLQAWRWLQLMGGQLVDHVLVDEYRKSIPPDGGRGAIRASREGHSDTNGSANGKGKRPVGKRGRRAKPEHGG